MVIRNVHGRPPRDCGSGDPLLRKATGGAPVGQAPGVVDGGIGDSLRQSVATKTERRRQPDRSQTAQRQQRRLGGKTLAERGHVGATARELFRQQANHMPQGVGHRAHAALHPAHRAGQFDGIRAQLVCRLDQTRRLLGNRDHRFQLLEGPWQPRSQAIGQQTECGVRLRTVPAGNPCAGRCRAWVGAVTGERASAVGVIGAPLQPCSAPGFGANVLLAGVPRLVPKLHRPRPAGGTRAGHFFPPDYGPKRLTGTRPSGNRPLSRLFCAPGL